MQAASILQSLQGQSRHQAEPISDLQAVCQQGKPTHVLPTAASLVLLDPTEAPAPKKENHW